MKVFDSFFKEVKLSSKSFYFYIEFIMAVILLLILLFVVPENFDSKSDEYICLNAPTFISETFISTIEGKDIDSVKEEKIIEVQDKEIKFDFYETEDVNYYITYNKDDLVEVCKSNKKIGLVLNFEDETLKYEYYLQGYESEKVKNLFSIIHEIDIDKISNEEVVYLSENNVALTDRQNLLPSFLTFNGSLMGLFIIAAYIFLDKKEGVIKALAVTPLSILEYLMSKIMLITLVSIVSSLIITIPIMGTSINYFLLLLFLICTGFFASSLGLLIASFYKDMTKAFGGMYITIMILIIPNIMYFIPTFNNAIVKIVPTYLMLEGFKELMINGSTSFILISCLIFFVIGLVLLMVSNFRYKKNLSV